MLYLHQDINVLVKFLAFAYARIIEPEKDYKAA